MHAAMPPTTRATLKITPSQHRSASPSRRGDHRSPAFTHSIQITNNRDENALLTRRGRRPRRPATPCFPPRLPSKHFRFSCISPLAIGEFHMPSAYFTREAHFTRRRRISLRRNARRHAPDDPCHAQNYSFATSERPLSQRTSSLVAFTHRRKNLLF